MSDSEDNNYVLIPLKNKDKEVVGHAKVDKADFEEVSKYVWRKVEFLIEKSKIFRLKQSYATGTARRRSVMTTSSCTSC